MIDPDMPRYKNPGQGNYPHGGEWKIDPVTGLVWCPRCKSRKPRSEFTNLNKTGKPSTYCRVCEATRHREWLHSPKGKELAKKSDQKSLKAVLKDPVKHERRKQLQRAWWEKNKHRYDPITRRFK